MIRNTTAVKHLVSHSQPLDSEKMSLTDLLLLPKHLPWILIQHEIWMRFMGFWSVPKNFPFIIYLIHTLYTIVSLVALALIIVVNILYKISDLEQHRTESICQLLIWALCASQLIVFFQTRKQGHELWLILTEAWVKARNQSDERKRKIIKNTESSMIFMSYAAQLSGLLVILGFKIVPLVLSTDEKIASTASNSPLERGIWLRIWLPYSLDYYPAYVATYFFVLFVTAYGSFTAVTLVLFYSLMMKIITAHLKLLHLDIKNSLEIIKANLLTASDEVAIDDNIISNIAISTEHLHKHIDNCVKEHQKILGWCVLMEDILNPLMLALFIVESLLICFTIFVAVLDPIGKMQYALTGVLSICYMLLYFVSADDVIAEGRDLSEAIFHCGWEHLKHSRKLSNTLRIMMKRAQKPIKLTAGKYLTLTLDNFVGLIKTSYSYFTLLETAHQVHVHHLEAEGHLEDYDFH